MRYDVELKSRARKDLRRIAKSDVVQIVAALDELSSMATVADFSIGDSRVKSLVDLIGLAIDWDLILRITNPWYDRMAAAMRGPTRSHRREALDEIAEDVRTLTKQAQDWMALALPALADPRLAFSVRLGRILIALTSPALSAAANAEDRGFMQLELTKLAFALAAYRADNGGYPAKLADLTPKYLAEVPKDIFTDAELHYAREGDGYLLYSVGANGKDDGGKSYDDRKEDEDWDDLTIRMSAATKAK
jgi:hypothetical protein